MKKLILLITIMLAIVATAMTATEHKLLDTPVVRAQMGKLYDKAAHTFVSGGPRNEYYFTVNADGSVTPIITSGTADKNKIDVPTGTQTIVHTHPNGTHPQPGPNDVTAAQAADCPNYDLSQDQLWVANIDGTTAKVGDVEFKHGEVVIKWTK